MPPSVVLLNSSWRSSTNHFIPWILSIIVLWLAVCILPALIKRFSSVVLIFKLLTAIDLPLVLIHLIIFLSTPLSSASHIHHLIIIFFLFPLSDLNTACFSFSSPLYCPQLLKFLRSVEKYWCHFCQDFANSIGALFVWQSFFCSGINSHISKIMSISKSNCWNEIREMLVFFFKYFWNSSFFGQRPNIRHSIHLILWLSCILKTEIDSSKD